MRVDYLPRALDGLSDAPAAVRTAFYKQVALLQRDVRHPSLRAKKFDESKGMWQARVNRSWRFYFTITRDT